MKTTNKALILITGTSLAFLIGIAIQLLFAFGTVNLYDFNWIQWTIELIYILLCISIGLRVSISIVIEEEKVSLGPVESINEELEQAISYINLLEKHMRYNDNAEEHILYVPYDSTELELQITEFKNKHYDNRR
jgi:hypothetical protein